MILTSCPFSFQKIISIYLFMSVLGLRCCAGFSLGAVAGGYSLDVVPGLLIAVCGFLCCGAWVLGIWSSVVVTHRLSSCSSQALEHRSNSCGSWAQMRCSMWDNPSSEIKLVSSALAGEFFTIEPSGKPLSSSLIERKSPILQSWEKMFISKNVYHILLCVR